MVQSEHIHKIINMLKYRDKQIKLADYQQRIVEKSFDDSKKYLLVVASTRAGKTFSLAVTALIHALLGKDVVIIAPIYAQSLIMMRTIWDIIIDTDLMNSGLLNTQREMRQDMITFSRGNRIKILSCHNEQSLLGHGADLVIIDEAVLIEDEVYEQYILRMIMNNPSAKIIAISTSQKKNFFYTLITSQEYEDKREVIRITVDDAVRAGIMSQESVDEARKTLTDEEFRYWYYAEFPDDAQSEEMISEEYVHRAFHTKFNDLPAPEPNGKIELELYGAIDVARYNDYTVAVIIHVKRDVNNELYNSRVKLIDYIILRNMELQQQSIILADFLQKYRCKEILVDSQGMGVVVYDELKKWSYSDGTVYPVRRLILNERTVAEKDSMALLLGTLFKRGLVDLSCVKDQDKNLVTEHLTSLTVEKSAGRWKVKKSTKSTQHDDFADALIYAFWSAMKDLKIRSVNEMRVSTANASAFRLPLNFKHL